MTRLHTVILAGGAAIAGLTVVGAPAGAQHKHDCSYCHDLHGASYPQLTVRDLQVDLCSYCHDPDGLQGPTVDGKTIPWQGRNAADSSGFVDHIGGAVGISCWDCHDHEGEAVLASGDTNFVMIGDSVTTPSSGRRPLVFTAWSGTNSFADGDATYDGVCEACHTQTTYHLNTGGGAAHNGGADCTTCHKHDTGFQGTGGGCTGCHSSSQGSRRPIVAEFDRTSHHIELAAAGYASSADIPDSECEVCHDQSQHQQGSVRLKNADAPTVVYALTGDPATSSAEAAKLTAFCLACHDGDGAGGAPPFADGVAPPIIDNNAWTSSSHNTAGPIAGCYGDGAFGCHATGHGSEKTKLLAPAGTPATAPAYAEQEEQFCFNCHDSDGPATSDIDGLFSTAVRWVTAPVGDNGNVNLNDRHDVQHSVQSTSGAKLECTDCHDPHTAKSTAGDTLELLRADPDPTDGRTPATVSEWCLDCHDGSFPPTVTAPTTALNDVRTSNLTDGMGAGSGNAVLKSGYGWADGDNVPCYACHVPHVVNSTTKNNLFHLVQVVKSKDGTTDVPSDNVGLNYEVTDNSVKSAPVNGYEWCNTCHTGSMGDKKDNCYSCHYHGTRW